MVEIGGQPILWHILKHYSHFGFSEFVIALGHRGEVIKRFFHDYHALSGNMTVRTHGGEITHQERLCEDWTVHLVETGPQSNTGGRIKRLEPWLGRETFMATYGDGVSDVDLGALLAFHRAHGRLATVTAVRPPARFGGLVFDGDRVTEFTEKPQVGEGWINGGFFVFEPGLFRYLKNDATVLESDALEAIARDGELMAFRHDRFWQCMDTLRDKRLLEAYWQNGQAPWKQWA